MATARATKLKVFGRARKYGPLTTLDGRNDDFDDDIDDTAPLCPSSDAVSQPPFQSLLLFPSWALFAVEKPLFPLRPFFWQSAETTSSDERDWPANPCFGWKRGSFQVHAPTNLLIASLAFFFSQKILPESNSESKISSSNIYLPSALRTVQHVLQLLFSFRRSLPVHPYAASR